jgi:RNA polymerase sigma-70 factor (ECF subfamily)
LIYSELDDEALLRLISDGHAKALGELYDRYGRLIYSIAIRIVGEQGAAEEITLDIFTKVWDKADSYRPDRGAVRTWLSGMTRNRAIDNLRREKVRQNTQRKLWVEKTSSTITIDRGPESKVDLSMRKERLRSAISRLSEDQQEVLALAYFQGYTQSKIAQHLDLPLGTVKTRIRSAIIKLRSLLKEEHHK